MHYSLGLNIGASMFIISRRVEGGSNLMSHDEIAGSIGVKEN